MFSKKELRLLSTRYCLILACYWGLFCSFYTYATVFLLGHSFTSSSVGIIIALGNVLGLLLQPMVAAQADRGDRMTLHQIICLLALLMAVLGTILFLLPLPTPGIALLFMGMDCLMWTLMPLTNSLSVYYINRRIAINFGISRGMGSIGYAIVSSLLSFAVTAFGSSITMVFNVVLMLLMILLVLQMPVVHETAQPFDSSIADVTPAKASEQAVSSALGREVSRDCGQIISADSSTSSASMQNRDADSVQNNDSSVLTFFRRYPRFGLTVLGFTLIFIFHNMSNNYMIYLVEALGGTEGTMGSLFAIQAIVELPAMFGIALLLKKFSASTLMKIAALFFAIKAASYILAFDLPTLYGTQLLQSVSYALFTPASVYYVNEIMKEADKVKGQAFMTMTNTLGGIIGSLLGGFLLSYASLRVLMNIDLALAAGGALLVWIFNRSRAKSIQSLS